MEHKWRLSRFRIVTFAFCSLIVLPASFSCCCNSWPEGVASLSLLWGSIVTACMLAFNLTCCPAQWDRQCVSILLTSFTGRKRSQNLNYFYWRAPDRIQVLPMRGLTDASTTVSSSQATKTTFSCLDLTPAWEERSSRKAGCLMLAK